MSISRPLFSLRELTQDQTCRLASSVPGPDLDGSAANELQGDALFDHLVRDGEHTRRNAEAKHFGDPEVDDELELRGL